MNDERFIAVHKEFTRDHKVISTLAYKSEEGAPLEEVQAWCDQVNAKGFNYRPYLIDEFLPLAPLMKPKERR